MVQLRHRIAAMLFSHVVALDMEQRLANLCRRSEMLRKLREFFDTRDFMEVETPLLSAEVIPELHIEPLRVGNAYLQASPELHMKRLVADGMPMIFQVTRSFRADEYGDLHNPEFTIVEWYRVGDGMRGGMQLLDELCQILLGTPPAVRTSYAEAFETHVGISPHAASVRELAECAARHRVAVPTGMPSDDRDEWLNLLLAACIEPQLGRATPEILYDYPATQSSLAQTVVRADNVAVAERFELYWHGVELANGYHELTDATELRQRLIQVNAQRESLGRPTLPLPESLLDAMKEGLPECTGCALGFDRLVMLACGAEKIADVMTSCENQEALACLEAQLDLNKNQDAVRKALDRSGGITTKELLARAENATQGDDKA